MKSLFIGMATLALLSACSSTGPIAPVENRLQTGTNARSSAGAGTGVGAGNAIGSNSIGVGDASRTITPVNASGANGDVSGTAGANGTQVGKSIYFDYNEFIVKPEYQDMLRQNFGSQSARNSAPIRLEGNADERGSSEYNLALGQKRAEAVKKQLQVLGVPEAQLEAVSFGSEKPRETCHEERCWAANRRVDLMRLGR